MSHQQLGRDVGTKIRGSFIKFRHLKRIMERAAALVSTDWRGCEPEHFVVLGETGVGKSRVLEHILGKHPAVKHETYTEVPVLYVKVPANCTVNLLCGAMLQSLGSPFWSQGDIGDRQHALITLMQRCKVRLVILDEINHLIERGKHKTHYALGDWVKQIGKLGGASFLLSGTPRAILLLQTNEQLGDRFSEVITLRPLSAEDGGAELRGALRAFKKMMTSIDTFDFDDVQHVKTFGYATGGRLRAIRRLLIRAAEIACREEAPKLSWETMSQAFTEVIFPGCPAERNPFSTKFNGSLLNKPGEPFAPREGDA